MKMLLGVMLMVATVSAQKQETWHLDNLKRAQSYGRRQSEGDRHA